MKKILYLFLGLSLFASLLSRLDFQIFNKESGCPFCEGPILQRQLFLREGTALGLLTHKPAAPGHVLIIPQRHVERFDDLTAEEMGDIQKAIQKIHTAVQRAYGYEGYVLVQKNGPDAGQSVPHLHFHYVPAARFLPLRFFLSPWLKPITEDQMKEAKGQLNQVHPAIEGQAL